eukprot:CAMPEP_0115167824 /NCGR_PEP_ID=MMETSP0270-20121206/427_1 /TAXON_ID=71861 /ORGANISM="Scrippsiella trochoidea, Strain CCMP3099" /LENGTH=221 /DNA_ID=CAMNT_0002580453 /DNA_START=289 /DNA_END=954 /DNA_ORIENTATION=+
MDATAADPLAYIHSLGPMSLKAVVENNVLLGQLEAPLAHGTSGGAVLLEAALEPRQRAMAMEAMATRQLHGTRGPPRQKADGASLATGPPPGGAWSHVVVPLLGARFITCASIFELIKHALPILLTAIGRAVVVRAMAVVRHGTVALRWGAVGRQWGLHLLQAFWHYINCIPLVWIWMWIFIDIGPSLPGIVMLLKIYLTSAPLIGCDIVLTTRGGHLVLP